MFWNLPRLVYNHREWDHVMPIFHVDRHTTPPFHQYQKLNPEYYSLIKYSAENERLIVTEIILRKGERIMTS